MADSREIKITIIGDAKGAKGTFASAGEDLGTFDTKVSGLSSKMGTFGSVMAGVVAGGAIQQIGGFLKNAAQAAADDAASTERLKVAVENSGVSWDSMAASMDAAIKNGQALAFSDDDTRAALTALTQETGSSEEALKRLSIAQDLSRGTGMSLEQAAKLLGKTTDENTSTLARYGITLADNATAQDVMNEVDKRFGGQAAAFAQTGAGQWAILQDQLGEVEESIGAVLIPVMTTLVGAISGVVDQIQPLIARISDSTPALVGIATAIMALVVPAMIAMAVSAAAAIVPLLPFIAVAAAIGVAAALLYEAWSTNFLGIQDITTQVMDFLGPYIDAAFKAIQVIFDFYVTAWTLIITTGLAVIQGIFETVWPIIQAVFETVFPIIDGIITFYIDAWTLIITTGMGAIQTVVETVWPIVQTVIETAMTAIQSAVELGTAAAGVAVDLVMGPGGSILGAVQSGMDAVLSAVDAVLGVAGSVVTNVTTGVGLVLTAVDGVLGAAGTVLSAVQDGVDAIFDAVDAVLGVAGTLVTAVGDGIDAVKTAIETALQGAIDRVGELASDMYNAGRNFVQQLIDGIKSLIPDLGGAISGITDKLDLDIPFRSPPDEAGYEIGREYMGGLVDGLESRQPALDSTMADVGASMGGRAGGAAYLAAVGAGRRYTTTPTGTQPDRLGRMPGDPCWGKPASCDANAGASQALNLTDRAAYAARVHGVLLKSGLIGYANVSGGGVGDVYIDGHKAGFHIGAANMRGKFHRQKLSPNPC
jgi:hypothetical protein